MKMACWVKTKRSAFECLEEKQKCMERRCKNILSNYFLCLQQMFIYLFILIVVQLTVKTYPFPVPHLIADRCRSPIPILSISLPERAQTRHLKERSSLPRPCRPSSAAQTKNARLPKTNSRIFNFAVSQLQFLSYPLFLYHYPYIHLLSL